LTLLTVASLALVVVFTSTQSFIFYGLFCFLNAVNMLVVVRASVASTLLSTHFAGGKALAIHL
jgi:hypothetical protein